MEVLRVNGLTKTYGSLIAVNNLNFSLKRGEVYGILGPNGSGKTTTLAMLSEAIHPSSGEFLWFGKDSGLNQRSKLGIMLEKPNFYDYLSAKDNLKIIADIRGVDYSEIDIVLKRIGLFERRNSHFKTFSLGMKQRLAIGAAVLGDPQVLILDEPTNGLDPEGIAEVRELIRKMAGEEKTILLASHLLDEVQKVCTQMIVLKKGNIIYDGSVNANAKNEIIIELMAEDIAALTEVLKQSVDFANFERKKEMIFVKTAPNITTSILNAYMQQHDILLSHLAYKKQSLEEDIFEILNEIR